MKKPKIHKIILPSELYMFETLYVQPIMDFNTAVLTPRDNYPSLFYGMLAIVSPTALNVLSSSTHRRLTSAKTLGYRLFMDRML
jgi:hypothetical protein